MTKTTIEALPKKWREIAEAWDALDSGADHAEERRLCADELEAALAALSTHHPEAQQPEAVTVWKATKGAKLRDGSYQYTEYATTKADMLILKDKGYTITEIWE